jgi:predicted RNase H-like HicB family nuclease
MKPFHPIYFFPIQVDACDEGGFFAECSTLQGCHAEGETYGEVIDNIQDVIKAHLELREKHGELISSFQLKKRSDIHIQMPVPIEM